VSWARRWSTDGVSHTNRASVPAGGIVVQAVAVADVVCPVGSSRPVSTLTQSAETTNTATAPAPINVIRFHRSARRSADTQ
jgi:hypothetical protein